MKSPVTFLTYLRFDPPPHATKLQPGQKKPQTYFMHVTPPFREGQPYYFHTQKRAENFVAKLARNWGYQKFASGTSVRVTGIVVRVDALLPPLHTNSLKELKANHQIFEVQSAKEKK